MHLDTTQVGQLVLVVVIAVAQWYTKRALNAKTDELHTATEKQTQLLKGDTETLKEQTSEIHVLVNSRLTEALERIKMLETALKLRPGAPVPKRRKP